MSRPTRDLLSGAVRVGQMQRGAENSIAELLASARADSLPVESIQDRRNCATRKIDPDHVLSLAVSISTIRYLIQPITTDSNHCLLAGGHRYVALRLLAVPPEQRGELWATIFGKRIQDPALNQLLQLPVRQSPVTVNILPFDSAIEQQIALEVEVSENEKRKDYSRTEIKGLIERLKSAGYQDLPGRPPDGIKALTPALCAITGKSRRTVQRILAHDDEPIIAPNGAIIGSTSEDERLANALERWLRRRGGDLSGGFPQQLIDDLLRFLKPDGADTPT